MNRLSQREALTKALHVLRALRSEDECAFNDRGDCTTHNHPGPGTCPQFHLHRLLTQHQAQGGFEPPYSALALDALMRGCTQYLRVHVTVAVNGYTHRGRLQPHLDMADPLARRYAVVTRCGSVIENIKAEDVLEADISTHDLNGVPLDPRHDPK